MSDDFDKQNYFIVLCSNTNLIEDVFYNHERKRNKLPVYCKLYMISI